MWRKATVILVASWMVVGGPYLGASSSGGTLPPAAEALHLLPPLGPTAWQVRNDLSLLPFVRVAVCRVEGEACPLVAEYTGESQARDVGGQGEQHGGLVLGGDAYHANWHVRHQDVGSTFRISFDVAGLDLGRTEVAPRVPRTMAIRFLIEPSPRVRARALHAGGASAAEIAVALLDEFQLAPGQVATVLVEEAFDAPAIAQALRSAFNLDALGVAQTLAQAGFGAVPVGLALRSAGFGVAEIAGALRYAYGLDAGGVAKALRAAGFGVAEIAGALRDAYDLDAGGVAKALRAAGYGAEDVYPVLRSVFGLDEAAAWAIVEQLGYDPEEIFQARAAELAVRFAPQLRFDNGSGTCSASDSYPMSAQHFFEHWTPWSLISNGDASTVTGNLVPTYWKAFRCGNQYRLVYWWFYGYQFECDCVSGRHHGDWEHLLVVLSEDKTRIAAVTFFQHGGYYTRLALRGGFDVAEGTHPVVYPGRNAHGSYHNTETWAQTCCYWEDHRNGNGPWLSTWAAPLERLRPVAQGGEPWMDADLAGTYTWGEISTHPMQSTSGSCGQQTCAGTPTWGCHESGCYRSQCELGDRDDGITCWHCPPGYTDWGFACTKCDCGGCSTTSIESYGLRYTISMTDAGLMYHAP